MGHALHFLSYDLHSHIISWPVMAYQLKAKAIFFFCLLAALEGARIQLSRMTASVQEHVQDQRKAAACEDTKQNCPEMSDFCNLPDIAKDCPKTCGTCGHNNKDCVVLREALPDVIVTRGPDWDP